MSANDGAVSDTAAASIPMCIWLVDLTGREWRSDPDTGGELTAQAMAEFADQAKNLRAISSFHLKIDGQDVYFNPAHIVAWGFAKADAPGPLGSGGSVRSVTERVQA